MHECGSVRLTYVKHRIFDEIEAIGVDGSVLYIEDTLNVSLNAEISISHDEEEESRIMRYRGFLTISDIHVPVTVRTSMSFYYQCMYGGLDGCPGGGGGTPPKLGYNAQHKLKIWTLKTSEKGGLKDLKRVFDKF